MLAQQISARFLPSILVGLQAVWSFIVILSRRACKVLSDILTHLVTDIPVIASAGAICWGFHFWSVPLAWIFGGIFGLLFMMVIAGKPR